jgi:hypothetical protein
MACTVDKSLGYGVGGTNIEIHVRQVFGLRNFDEHHRFPDCLMETISTFFRPYLEIPDCFGDNGNKTPQQSVGLRHA